MAARIARITTSIALGAGAALMLAACSAGATDVTPTASMPSGEVVPSADPSASESATSAPDASASPDASTSPDAADNDVQRAVIEPDWLGAIALAQDTFDGQLLSIDLDNGVTEGWHWTIDLASATEEVELTIGSDGTVTETERETLDGDDAAEIGDEVFTTDGLIAPDDAVPAALAAVSGTATGWTLEREDGVTRYSVEIDQGADDDVDVYVDATSAEVIGQDD